MLFDQPIRDSLTRERVAFTLSRECIFELDAEFLLLTKESNNSLANGLN